MTTSWAIFTGFVVILSVVAIIGANALPAPDSKRRKIGKIRIKKMKINAKTCAAGLDKRR